MNVEGQQYVDARSYIMIEVSLSRPLIPKRPAEELARRYVETSEYDLARGYKFFSCSTQPSMKFQLLIKTKMLKNKDFALSNSEAVFIMLINVRMPTIVGILTFMSMTHFMLC